MTRGWCSTTGNCYSPPPPPLKHYRSHRLEGAGRNSTIKIYFGKFHQWLFVEDGRWMMIGITGKAFPQVWSQQVVVTTWHIRYHITSHITIFAFFTSRGPPELIYSTHVNIMDRREGGQISNAVRSTRSLPSTRLPGFLGNNISLIVMCDVMW